MRELTNVDRRKAMRDYSEELAALALAKAEELFPDEPNVSTYVAGQVLAFASTGVVLAGSEVGVDTPWFVSRLVNTLQMALSAPGAGDEGEGDA